MKKLISMSAAILMVSLSACNSTSKNAETGDSTSTPLSANSTNTANDEKYVGSWVEPNPVNAKEVQGVELLKDGTAKSINMATLVYQNWWTKSDTLYLVAKSIGNGSSSVDTTTYKVENVTENSLTLKDKELTISYKRK